MRQVRQKVAESVAKKPRYLLVDKRFITEGERVEFDLFCPAGPNSMTLFLQSDTVVNGECKVRLREMERLYIDEMERPAFDEYVARHIRTIAANSDLPVEEKAAVVYEKATSIVDTMFRHPEAPQNLRRSESIVGGMVDTILHDKATVSSLMKITAHDYYTHTHCINVSLYALALGSFHGMSEEELQALGVAALLHDLGKSRIDADIINKNGPLSDVEFGTMKGHPLHGYDIACEMGISDERILSGIRHHHEKMSGQGYPDRLGAEGISHFARLIGVCDVFDALTTKRSYKEPMSSFEALLLMKKEMPGHLDTSIVDAFIRMLRE